MRRVGLSLALTLVATGCGDNGGVIPQPQEDASFDNSLRGTGLWVDFDGEVLAEGVRPFEPQFKLWSDGSEKRRWIYLPPGESIGTSDMDSWQFPVGTKLWKEFTRDGKRVETRLLELTGEGAWKYQAYEWNEAESDAVLVDAEGKDNVRGTDHDIPSVDDCGLCHARTPHVALGFSAIQLDYDPSDPEMLALDDLVADELLSDPPAGTTPRFTVDAEAGSLAAYGYLHVNCGNCHNDFGDGVLDGTVDFWRRTEDTTSEAVLQRYNVVGINASKAVPQYPAANLRVDPGVPDQSQVYVRMRQEVRGTVNQMPQLGTEEEDLTGIAVISDWIEALVP